MHKNVYFKELEYPYIDLWLYLYYCVLTTKCLVYNQVVYGNKVRIPMQMFKIVLRSVFFCVMSLTTHYMIQYEAFFKLHTYLRIPRDWMRSRDW